MGSNWEQGLIKNFGAGQAQMLRARQEYSPKHLLMWQRYAILAKPGRTGRVS